MTKRSLRFVQRVALLTTPLTLVACGGGSSGGGSSDPNTEGLEPPDQLTLVEPVDTVGAGSPDLGQIDLPEGSDYAADRAEVNVYDPAVEPLTTVNEILCFVGLTGANLVVNEGPFLAQIDPSLCEAGEDQNSLGSEDGQSTGATEFELWTVDTTRASNSSPQLSSIWVPDRSGDNALEEEIRVGIQLDEGVSAENPFGDWSMDFAGIDPSAPDVENPFFLGTLSTVPTTDGEIGFTFYEESGDVTVAPPPGEYARRTQVHVRASEDQTEGYARIIVSERSNEGGDSGLIASEFLVAFDETHFLRSIDGGSEELYDREAFDERVWQYNLYHATGEDIGERVQRDSGFGFRTEDGAYGYAGYYGVWVPDGVELQSGDAVFRDVFDEPSELVEYTVTRGGGKLVRFSREDLPLDDVQDDLFQWWTFDDLSGEHQQYLISWDGANWVIKFEVDSFTFDLTTVEPPLVIDTMDEPYLSMWSDGLGGPASWTIDEPLVVTYYSRTIENGNSSLFANGGEVTLLGLVDCLRSDITEEEAEIGDIFLPPAMDVMSPYTFVFGQDDLTLYHDVNGDGSELVPVGLAAGEEPNEGPFTWGMQSGPLVTNLTGVDDVWDVWQLETFWQYETGHNDWNVLWSLADGQGIVVDFEPPLQFSYTHSTEDDRNGASDYDGKTYFLSYDGPGQLHGLPYEGVDLNNDMEDDRYYPVLSIADGTLVGPTGTEYIVKAVEVEQVLTQDPGGNPGLDLTEASDLVVPDGSGYTPPAIGDRPVVTDPPRVINGELVGDEGDDASEE